MENYYLIDIKRDYFSYENKALYDYIEKLTKNNKYNQMIDKQPREFAQKMSEMSKRLGLIGA